MYLGYEGLYKVSNLGNVKGLRYNSILKQSSDKRGYKHVIFYKNGIKKTKGTHQLVAQAFIPNPENRPEVNHIDGDKENNKVENLEWCTHSENQLHKYRKLKCKPNIQKAIIGLDLKTNEIKYFENKNLAEKYLKGIGYDSATFTNINKNIKGLYKYAYGHIWYEVNQQYCRKEQFANVEYKVEEEK